MKPNLNLRTAGPAGLLLAGALGLVALAGCVVEEPSPPPAYSEVEPMPDDFVYYPEYEVYYSNIHHEYVYRDGNSWVTRPTPPPRVTVNILLSSPSVPMNFHDHPAGHHNTVVRDYPRNWTPPPPAKPAKNRNDRRDDHDKDHPGQMPPSTQPSVPPPGVRTGSPGPVVPPH